MATTTPTSEVKDLETAALEHLGTEGSQVPEVQEPEEEQVVIPVRRIALVISMSVVAAAIMTGGIFAGVVGPRLYAIIGGVLGVMIAAKASQIKRAPLAYALILGGIFAIGLLLVAPSGLDNLFGLGAQIKDAIQSGKIHRPPVNFDPGWHALVGWLMAAIGFAAGWVGTELKRPALGLLVPLPLILVTAISVPPDSQVLSGIVCLVFFAIGMGLLSGTQIGEDESQRPSLAYELRRGARALPLLAIIGAALYFLPGVLFPKPLYDPQNEAQKPKTVPNGHTKDQVLFKVRADFTGPWRTGGLDVYKESDGSWRVPAVKASKLDSVPTDGVVDPELTPAVKAEIETVGIGGSVLPGLPNIVGIKADGPKLAFDARNANIQLAEGNIKPGLKYTVFAAGVPKVEQLQEIKSVDPKLACVPKTKGSPAVPCSEFLKMPDPPATVKSLLSQAPSSNPWDRFEFVRERFLDTVKGKGSGVPVEIFPSKVEDMLSGTKLGTPFEIVAAQAMIARWAGVPSRIAYGFDQGDKVGDHLEIHPKNGSSYIEVYFPNFKWLPIIGKPKTSVTPIGGDASQVDPNQIASNEVSVRVIIPIELNAKSYLYAQIRHVLGIVLPIALLFLLLYYGSPAIRKFIIHSRRRSWAAGQGLEARIALAYAEWRDWCTDFGYRFDADTPLMFLDRVVEDEEHTELAWLVTRTLWGDLRTNVASQDANAAEELSKSLRKRLTQAHTATLRTVAALSRLSLKHPYAPTLGEKGRKSASEAA